MLFNDVTYDIEKQKAAGKKLKKHPGFFIKPRMANRDDFIAVISVMPIRVDFFILLTERRI